MRITFILPSIYLTGGTKVVGEYANCLTDRGHHVTLVYPIIPLRHGAPWFDWNILYTQVMQGLGNIRKGIKMPWFDLNASLHRPLTLSAHVIPEADIIVATSWPTAYYVHRYPQSRGKKFYLIQHHELWSGPEGLVNGTWTLPLQKVVIASWLKDLAEQKFGQSVIGPIVNGINLNHFYGKPRQPSSQKRVGILWHHLDWKGCADGLQSFEQAREVMPDLTLVVFATQRFSDLPDYAEFHQNPPIEKIRDIYNSCDVFLSPSWSEGSQAPPMEAMACGCAVIATNVGGIPDYAVAGETAIVVPPKRSDLMGKSLIDLLQDDDKRRRIALAGQKHIQQFTWDRATDKLVQVFEEELRSSSC